MQLILPLAVIANVGLNCLGLLLIILVRLPRLMAWCSMMKSTSVMQEKRSEDQVCSVCSALIICTSSTVWQNVFYQLEICTLKHLNFKKIWIVAFNQIFNSLPFLDLTCRKVKTIWNGKEITRQNHVINCFHNPLNLIFCLCSQHSLRIKKILQSLSYSFIANWIGDSFQDVESINIGRGFYTKHFIRHFYYYISINIRTHPEAKLIF